MINKLIGNTPLIKIKYEFKGQIKNIYTKLEFYNLTGSIKDRIAFYMIKNAKEKEILKENMPIIEVTSGNTGIALAALAAYYKHPLYIFMPNWVSEERKKLIEMYGANIILISKEEGGFKECIRQAKELSKKINGFYIDQFSNQNNVLAHYETTGKEIIDKIKVDGFITGIGTGGTLVGTALKLKEKNKTKIFAIEPKSMSLIKEGKIGEHKIEGIGDEFIPEIVDLDIIDEIILVEDDEAIKMSQKLSKELGIGVGISSGANMIGAVLMHEKVDGNIVTVFPDDLKKYITTDLKKEIKGNTLADKITLLDFEII